MTDNSNSKIQHMKEALALWGRVCGRQGACDVCPIGAIRGTNVTCQDFAQQFPEKFLSLLQEIDADKDNYTYYNEYCVRFPECNQSVETVSQIACRMAIFEGSLNCPYGDNADCVSCWSKPYKGDISGESSSVGNGTDNNVFDEDAAIKALLG